VSRYVLAIADDELIIGHRHSEWTGFAPDIESDVALSSIAQEEIGHAKLFYEQVAQLQGGTADTLAYGRSAGEFRNAVFVERRNGDWGYSMLRLFLYDRADAVRLGALAGGTAKPVAELASVLRREEKYHLMYGEQWLRHLAGASSEARERMQGALEMSWVEAEGLFAPVEDEQMLVGSGIMTLESAVQFARWKQATLPLLGELGLRPPAGGSALNGRQGEHTEALAGLLDEMTSVSRADPGASW
jgi:ring-1,2-phenylacetyl-CoA epoxidase subunit PaaC